MSKISKNETPKDLFYRISKNEFEKLKKVENTLFESIDTSINYDYHYNKFKETSNYYTYLHESTYEKIKMIKNYFYNDIMKPIMESVIEASVSDGDLNKLPLSKQFLIENSIDAINELSGIKKSEENFKKNIYEEVFGPIEESSVLKKKVFGKKSKVASSILINEFNKIIYENDENAFRFLNNIKKEIEGTKTFEDEAKEIAEGTLYLLKHYPNHKISRFFKKVLDENSSLREELSKAIEEAEIKFNNKSSLIELQETVLADNFARVLKGSTDSGYVYGLSKLYKSGLTLGSSFFNGLKIILGNVTLDTGLSVPILGSMVNALHELDDKKRAVFKTYKPDSVYAEDFLREYGKTTFSDIGRKCWDNSMRKIIMEIDPTIQSGIYAMYNSIKNIENTFYNINTINNDENILIAKFIHRLTHDKVFNRKLHFYRKCFYGNIIDYIVSFTKTTLDLEHIEKGILDSIKKLQSNNTNFIKAFRDFYQFKPNTEMQSIFKNAILALMDIKAIAIEMKEKARLYRTQDIYMDEDGTYILNKVNQALNEVEYFINDIENGKPDQYVKYEDLAQNNMKKLIYKNENELRPSERKKSIFYDDEDENYNRNNRDNRDNRDQEYKKDKEYQKSYNDHKKDNRNHNDYNNDFRPKAKEKNYF
jgi:hypothetical protein